MHNPFVVRDTPYIVQFLYYGTVFSSFVDATMTAGGTAYMQGITGANRLVHFTSIYYTHNGTDVIFEIYENSIFSANGTIVNPAVNQNRNSAKTAELVTYSNPPIPTSIGTLISHDRILASTAGKDTVSAASLASPGVEILFKKSTNHALKIVNNSTSNVTLSIQWQWFESGN